MDAPRMRRVARLLTIFIACPLTVCGSSGLSIKKLTLFLDILQLHQTLLCSTLVGANWGSFPWLEPPMEKSSHVGRVGQGQISLAAEDTEGPTWLKGSSRIHHVSRTSNRIKELRTFRGDKRLRDQAYHIKTVKFLAILFSISLVHWKSLRVRPSVREAWPAASSPRWSKFGKVNERRRPTCSENSCRRRRPRDILSASIRQIWSIVNSRESGQNSKTFLCPV